MRIEPEIVKKIRLEEKLGLLKKRKRCNTEKINTVNEFRCLKDDIFNINKNEMNEKCKNVESMDFESGYRTIFDNYTVAITLADEKERIIFWNKYAEEILNMTEEDLYLKPVKDLYPTKEWKIIRAENVRKKGLKYQMETKMNRKNENPFDVELSLCVLKNIGGEILGSVGIIKDITKLKKLERDLKKSEEKFIQLYEKAPVPYHTLNLDGTITHVNDIWCQIIGYHKGEVIGKPIFNFISEDEKKEAEISFKNKIQSKTSYSKANERTFKTKNGEKRKFSIHDFFSYDEMKNIKSIYTIMTDITELKDIENELKKQKNQVESLILERTKEIKNINKQLKNEIIKNKKVEKELIANEKRFRELFDNMKNGVSIYKAVDDGKDFEFVNFNKAGSKIDNIPQNDVIGRRVTQIFPGIKEFGLLDVFKEVWKTGKPCYHPISFYKDNRINGWRENYVYRISSGELVAIYNDVTEKKIAEENLMTKTMELEKFNKLAIGRELKMIELKKEINDLCTRFGESPRYVIGGKT